MPDIPTLTADQRAVVERSVDSRIVVTAGPGAGKTHTLVSRIEHLVAGEPDIAGQEVLSLSFSRAAVGELRRRVAALSGRGSRVRSATFDSFATRLLETYGDSSLEGADYDHRIELATELIKSRPVEELAEIRHVLVDEAQDLTGVRADFVLQLLGVTDSGFTVFADQAQAVYDFTGESPRGSSFVDLLMARNKGVFEALRLTTNHRTTDPQLLAIANLGESIRDSDADRDLVVDEFGNACRSLPAAGSIDDAAWMLQGSGNAAVLTRRNSEALAVSAILYGVGVKHQLRRRADDPVIGAWLSRLQRATTSNRMSLPDLERAASLLPWTPEITWAALSRADRPRKGTLNLEKVAEHIASRVPPDELLEDGSDGVVVSSIHRAKGLEFDTVLLVPFEISRDDWLQEARVLYVGLSRARHNLMTLKRIDDGRWSYATAAGRWRRIGFAGKRRYTTGVEISGSDAFTFDPVGASPPRRSPAEVDDYLLTAVRSGDPLVLELRAEDSNECTYDVLHDGQWVAATTPRFGEIVALRLDLKAPPARIEGCHVETIATTALPRSVAEMFDVRERLVPNCRIQGVGTW